MRKLEGRSGFQLGVGQGFSVVRGEGQGQIAFQRGFGHGQGFGSARSDVVARSQDGRHGSCNGDGQGDGEAFALDGADDVGVVCAATPGDQGGASQGRVGGRIGAGLMRAFAAVHGLGDGLQGFGQGLGGATG
ncbi:hypothetical protein D3C85_1243080 [compost metagenome]